jgi:hypothetical protein
MATDTERFEQIPRRDPLEDYLDAAAIIVSRAEVEIKMPDRYDKLPGDALQKAQKAARESLKYLIANRAYANDIRTGTSEEKVYLDNLSLSLLKYRGNDYGSRKESNFRQGA